MTSPLPVQPWKEELQELMRLYNGNFDAVGSLLEVDSVTVRRWHAPGPRPVPNRTHRARIQAALKTEQQKELDRKANQLVKILDRMKEPHHRELARKLYAGEEILVEEYRELAAELLKRGMSCE